MEQKYKWLCQVISAIGSCLDLEKVLGLAAEVAAQAAGCRACFFYLWDNQLQRLVVRGATPGYEQHIRSIQLKMGEGITGWTAQHLEPLLIKSDAMSDPRFKYVPGLQEERYQSFMTVPVVSSSGELIGVFTMYTMAPNEFPPGSLEFVQNVAMLVAGLIEKAKLYTEMERRLSVLDSLAGLSETVSSSERLEVILHKMTQITMDVLRTDLCGVWLVEGAMGSLSLQAFSSQFPQIRVREWELPLTDELMEWLQVDGPLTGTVAQLPRAFQRPFTRELGTWAASPLKVAEEREGMIVCFRVEHFPFVDEELRLLTTVANQGATAIARARLISYLSERNMKSNFFDALMSGNYRTEKHLIDQGRMLGCDLAKPHVVMIAEVAPRDERDDVPVEWTSSSVDKVLSLLGYKLEKKFPGCLFIRCDDMFQAILPTNSGNEMIRKALENIKKEMEQENPIVLFVGFGDTCTSVRDYPRGMEEAMEALRIGQTILWDKSGVTSFGDLGLYRYLYKIWVNDGMVRDRQQEMFVTLLTYDNEQGTSLLETLETYLECLGQVGEASKRLYVHRNTLRNRLQKISSIVGTDITDKANWFPLYIALQIVKLREGRKLASNQAIAAGRPRVRRSAPESR